MRAQTAEWAQINRARPALCAYAPGPLRARGKREAGTARTPVCARCGSPRPSPPALPAAPRRARLPQEKKGVRDRTDSSVRARRAAGLAPADDFRESLLPGRESCAKTEMPPPGRPRRVSYTISSLPILSLKNRESRESLEA